MDLQNVVVSTKTSQWACESQHKIEKKHMERARWRKAANTGPFAFVCWSLQLTFKIFSWDFMPTGKNICHVLNKLRICFVL